MADETTQPPAKSAKKPKLPYYATGDTSLLALEPGDAGNLAQLPKALIKDWPTTRQHLESRRASLHAWRTSWWLSSWQDLSVYLLPRRSLWLTQSPSGEPSPGSMLRGLEINNAIINSTGIQALDICRAGLAGGLASPARPWFVFTARDDMLEQPGVQEWLDESQNRVYAVLNNSNFYRCWNSLCGDVSAFGTSPLLMYEDQVDIVRFYVPALGEYYLSSGAREKDNAIFRLFVYTVSQIVDYFGLDNCPPAIRNAWAEKGAALEQEYTVGHAIEPNYELDGKGAGKVTGNHAAWREVYWLYGKSEEGPLSVAGFPEAPFIVSRWDQQSNDAYGRGPGQTVICDIKMLQVLERRLAEALEKVVHPPMVADIRLKEQPSSTVPGDITYADLSQGNPGIHSIYGNEFRPDIPAITAKITATEQKIERGFFVDLFRMIDSLPPGKATAYEISIRQSEKLGQLGPVFDSMMGNQKSILRRVFGIMSRRGLLPPVPPALGNIAPDVEFISTIALAQRAAATSGIEQIARFVGSLAATKPQVLDLVDWDETVAEYNHLLGNKGKIMNSPDKVAQIRQQQAQLQQQAQRAQMLQNGGTAAVQAAHSLSQTDIGGGQNALSALLGRGNMGASQQDGAA